MLLLAILMNGMGYGLLIESKRSYLAQLSYNELNRVQVFCSSGESSGKFLGLFIGGFLAAILEYNEVFWMAVLIDVFALGFCVYFYKTYGIKILGQHIEMNTISDKHYNGADNNVYLDSGYVYSLIVYGLVLTLIILIMYTLISRHIIKKGDVVLIVWFIVMLGAIVVNNFILNLIFNPLLFLFPKAINDFISGSSNGIYEEI